MIRIVRRQMAETFSRVDKQKIVQKTISSTQKADYIQQREKLISLLPRGGRRICSSAFLSRRPSGYYLPITSDGTIF